jgi:AcrR family transcriptional regulator
MAASPMHDEDRPLRADAVRNRVRVLDAAEEVLATQGLSAPIDEIAQRAGVGIGTVYRHFPTKEELYAAVVINRVQRMADEARALVDADDAGEAFYTLLSRWVGYGATSKALADALADSGIDLKAATAGVKRQHREAVEAVLVRAQQAGAVRDDVETDDLMSLLTGACVASAYAGFDPNLRARTLAILCDGLRPTERRLPTASSKAPASPHVAGARSRGKA